MSTAVVSANTLYDFGDVLYKNSLQTQKLSFKSSVEGKNQGSGMGQPVGLSRRNSNPVGKYSGMSNDYAALLNANQLNNNNNNNNNNSAGSNANNNNGQQHRKLDRSHSEPVEKSGSSSSQQQQQQQKSNINTSRYKTELCRPFEESGTCKYGDKCQFAHGIHELRTLVRHPKYKTELCRTFHTIGFCPYGPRCHFIHNADEARSKGVPGANGAGTPSSSSQPIRPKPLNFGGSAFSLGSTAESPSPPSSLSQSPTSIASFFSDETLYIPPYSPGTQTPAATTAATPVFNFTQEFLVRPPSSAVISMASTAPASVSSGSTTSEVDVDLDMEGLSLGSRGPSTSPVAVPEILNGAMAVSRNLRLPVFNNLSRYPPQDI